MSDAGDLRQRQIVLVAQQGIAKYLNYRFLSRLVSRKINLLLIGSTQTEEGVLLILFAATNYPNCILKWFWKSEFLVANPMNLSLI